MKLRFCNEEVEGNYNSHMEEVNFRYEHIHIKIHLIDDSLVIVPIENLRYNLEIIEIDNLYKKYNKDIEGCEKEIQKLLDDKIEVILKELVTFHKKRMMKVQSDYDVVRKTYSKELLFI